MLEKKSLYNTTTVWSLWNLEVWLMKVIETFETHYLGNMKRVRTSQQYQVLDKCVSEPLGLRSIEVHKAKDKNAFNVHDCYLLGFFFHHSNFFQHFFPPLFSSRGEHKDFMKNIEDKFGCCCNTQQWTLSYSAGAEQCGNAEQECSKLGKLSPNIRTLNWSLFSS